MLGIVLIASFHDVKTYTIPNYYPLIIVGLFGFTAAFIQLAPSVILMHVVSAIIAFLIGMGLFIAGLMGGGDIKLFAAIALWLLPVNLLVFTFFVTMSGLVISLIILLFYVFRQRLITDPPLGYKDLFRQSRKIRIPYGPAIALGSVLFFIVN